MKIAVTSPSFSENEILKNELLEQFPDCIFNVERKRFNENELIEYIDNADGLIIGLDEINKNIIDRLDKIKIISKFGVGLDNIDLDYCKEKNIFIGWTPGVNKLSVAEMAIAFMIMLFRNLYITSNRLKDGIWNKSGGINLSGKSIGIIGVGNVGKEVVRFLKPFECKIYVNDIIDQSDYYQKNNLIEMSKDEIFETCDIITVHTPLTEETTDLINKEVLVKMKNNVFLINTARGKIFNEEDLKWALETNAIAGAALDVYEEEPPSKQDFICLPNLICTPHIGGNSLESVLAMGRSAIRHLVEFFNK